jgi:CRP/FNR family transcriptional regulator
MATMVATLREVPYFSDLNDARLRELAASVREKKYDTGAMVLLEGEPCEWLGFVIGGRVKVVKVNADGKEQVLRLLGPGRTFNDVPVFDGGPNPGSVQAVERSIIGTLPKAAVQSLVETQPKVAVAVIRVLASRLRALTLMIEDLSLRGVVARVAKLLLDCAQGHPALLEGSGGTCQHRLTQQEIAAMTGSVREVVQRALKTLEREGAIRMERARVVVLDQALLERWSES